ncbi:MAG: hypothetical protein IJK83_08145 [Clostridiales bacterium]|nr:hypothetical protein [Clostridiales bacterium]
MAKTTKSGKSSRKAVTGGMIAVIVAIILIIACFFTYISGILPLTMTGISITETLADGSTKTVKNFSLLETNLHFKQTLSTYSSYGMVSEDNLDDIYNQETGETYRDWLLKQTAGDMESIALVERAAKQAGFMDMSAARKIASLDAETLDLYAQIYGFQTGSQYLAALYGTGMSKRAYTDYMARTTLADEYVSYLKQFDPAIVPTDDKIQADFDADPSAYTTFDFNYFFVGADTDADGNVTGLKEAVAAAKKISDATTDSASFRQACMDYLTEKDDQNSLASFANDQDPTFCDNYTTTTLTYLSEEITSFITGDSVTGDKTVIETDKGAYVVYIAQKGIDETKTVTYRILTLKPDMSKIKDPTEEDYAKAAADLAADAATYCTPGMSSLDFYKVVKTHSASSNELLEGGYNAGVTASTFEYSESNPISPSEVSAGEWLFDEARKAGDVNIVISNDNKQVTVYYFEQSAPSWYMTIKNKIISNNYIDWNATLDDTDPQYVINSGLLKTFIY